MTVLAQQTKRYSEVVKRSFGDEWGYGKKTVTVYQAAATLPIGSVLGSYIDTPVGTAGATVGTGNGVMGAITMTSNKDLVLGVYKLRIYRAVTNAGDFVLVDPNGKVVANGQVAGAFSAAGFAFTLADGSTDFVVGDTIPITVSGTVKYKLVEVSATDGTEVGSVVLVGDSTGNPLSVTVPATTDTTVLALYRGPAAVADAALTFGASVTAGAVRTAALTAFATKSGIDVLTQI